MHKKIQSSYSVLFFQTRWFLCQMLNSVRTDFKRLSIHFLLKEVFDSDCNHHRSRKCRNVDQIFDLISSPPAAAAVHYTWPIKKFEIDFLSLQENLVRLQHTHVLTKFNTLSHLSLFTRTDNKKRRSTAAESNSLGLITSDEMMNFQERGARMQKKHCCVCVQIWSCL